MAATLDRAIRGLAALDEPARRALYFHVAGRRAPVSRDQAAAAVGISRALAAFHLDKLVDAGLLVPEFRRLSGRSGPGAGRPSKLYRRSREQLAVSLPPRSYALAAGLLAEAVERAGGRARRSLERVALELGRRLGAEGTGGAGRGGRAGRAGGTRAALAAAARGLEPLGYEPELAEDGGAAELCLRNCPFHALTQSHRELVCGMNRALLEGYVAGGEFHGLRAVLQPEPQGDGGDGGRCCVVLRGSPGTSRSRRPRPGRRRSARAAGSARPRAGA